MSRSALVVLLSILSLLLTSTHALAQTARRKGETVEVKFPPDEGWHKCTIQDIKDGKYFVQKRLDRTFKQWITEDQIRNLNAEQAQANAESKAARDKDNAQTPKTARDPIAVGDIVEVSVFNQWKRGKVLEVSPTGELLVQHGGRFDKGTYKLSQLRDPAAEALEGKARDLVNELKPYNETISNLASAFDSSLHGNDTGNVFNENSLPKYQKELPEIRKLCEQYGDVPNLPLRGDPANVFNRPREICAMAREGADSIARKVMIIRLHERVLYEADFVVKEMEKVMTVPDQQVTDSMQQTVFDYAGWKAEQDKTYAPMFAKLGDPILEERFKAVDEKMPAFKAFLDKEGTTRTFEMPPYQDGALEGMVKAAVLKQYKGASILRIGSDYKIWVAYDEKTWVKSDSTYDYFRVEQGKNQYKRGWFLMKLPNRPYCQAREWIAARVNTGAPRVDYIAPAGLFMKCP